MILMLIVVILVMIDELSASMGFEPASRRAGSADAFGPATPLFYIYIYMAMGIFIVS